MFHKLLTHSVLQGAFTYVYTSINVSLVNVGCTLEVHVKDILSHLAVLKTGKLWLFSNRSYPLIKL